MIWGKSAAKEFEELVERVLKRKYPKTEWLLETSCPIKSKGIRLKIDFMLTNRKTGRKIVVDAKSGRVSISDLRQLEDYKTSARVSQAIIYSGIPISELTPGIKERAKKSGIKIIHTSSRSSWPL